MTSVVHRYQPIGAAARLFADRSPQIVLSGPAGTGKSRACLEKLHTMAMLNPHFRGLMVRKTQASLTSTALETWRKAVVAEALATGEVVWHGGSQQDPPQFKYTRNGSAVLVGGMDKATKIMSSEYDAIFVQEAIELTENDWEALTTRLRNGRCSFQQIMADTNPDVPTHWLKVRVNEGRTVMLESRHEDNPVIFDQATGQPTAVGARYIDLLDQLTGPRKARLRLGQWVGAEGVIYEGFDTAIHLLDRFEIPGDWPRYWSVDFGYTNPLVLQRWAVDPDGRLYLYAEQYRTQRIVQDHAADLRHHLAEFPEPWPVAIICDHDAEDRATLERHIGRSTVPAKKSVSDGIQAVQARLKVQPDGKPRIFLLRDAVMDRDQSLVDAKKPASTAEEIPGYIWATNGKDAPMKENDHGCDAMRYVTAQLDLGGRPNIRWL